MSEFHLNFVADGDVLNEYINHKNYVTIITGPLGSGKTFGSCYKLFKKMCTQRAHNGVRKSRCYAVRNTYSDLLTTTVKDWLEMFGDLGRYTGGGLEPPTQRLNFALDDGTTVKSELIFLALDRPADVKKLRGAQATWFWLNEIKELDKSVVDMADLRHGRYPSAAEGGASEHGMIGDTNSPDDEHWLYKIAEETKADGWTFFRQPGGLLRDGDNKDQFGAQRWVVNPDAENLKNLPPRYYERGQQNKAEDWIAVNLANEYGRVMDGKPVHPEYTDNVHCMFDGYEPDPMLPIILGYDFGRTPAAAFVQLTTIGRYVCFDEFVTEDMSASSFGPELKLYIDRHYSEFEFEGYGDPAGDSGGEQVDESCLRILRAAGLPARKAADNNKVSIRRASLSNPMRRNCMDGRPAFMVTPKAKMIRTGLRGGFCFRRLQVSGEKYSEKPDKNEYSHPVEACEYAMVGAGEGKAAVKSASNAELLNRVSKGRNPFNPPRRRVV